MAERVIRLIDSDREKSFFFAFGAGHFIGENNVIELVKRAGYQIESVPISGWYDEDTVVNRYYNIPVLLEREIISIFRRSKHRQNLNKQQRRLRGGERKPN